MKLKFVVSLAVAMLAGAGHAQTGTGTGGGTGTTAPGAPTGPSSPGTGGTPPPTLNPGIGENSFEARRRTQPATPPGQVLPGEIAVTNSVVSETNQLAVTNLTPTSQAGFTNRIMATNGSSLMRDQAISQADRQLLVQIHTAVFGSSQAIQSGATPVHFILRDGAVRIVGFVANADEQKRIEDAVQKVPGVVRVYNALQVQGSAAPGQTIAPGQTGQTTVPGQTTAPGETPAPDQTSPRGQTAAPGQPR